MDGGCYKLYHEHDFDTRDSLEKYFSGDPDMVFADDSIKFPMKQLYQVFNEGHIKGDLLIDLSFSSPVHQLYSASGCFQQIVVLKFNEKCLMELNRWINTRTGAFDWSHASEYITELEQKDDPVHEMKLKTAMVKTIKCDLGKENITDPVVLPPADCIISAFLLEAICKDQDDYICILKKITKLLNRGGHLILFGVLNASYFITGSHKYHLLNHDEEFTKKVLIGEGFTIKSCNVQKRKNKSDLIDYNGIMFIIAQKN